MATPAHQIQEEFAMPPAEAQEAQELQRTSLYARHKSLGAKLVPFAGYEMPLQYSGMIEEHKHTRSAAGLFDVSHMGQIELSPRAPSDDITKLFEQLVPSDIAGLGNGQMRYSVLTNGAGGVLDDLMITRFGNSLWLVVNAACKEADAAHLTATLGGQVKITTRERALLALQGPEAASVLKQYFPEAAALKFMNAEWHDLPNAEGSPDRVLVSRCGYCGEDGFEISLPNKAALKFMDMLLKDERVAPIGLGARDSLRLEAGLCLYGQDLTPATTPYDAALGWVVAPHRLAAGDFAGAKTLQAQSQNGTKQMRVGILPDEARVIPRAGGQVLYEGKQVGTITSGGFAPSLGCGVGMAQVAAEVCAANTSLTLLIRNKPQSARIVPLPFVPHNYFKGNK